MDYMTFAKRRLAMDYRISDEVVSQQITKFIEDKKTHLFNQSCLEKSLMDMVHEKYPNLDHGSFYIVRGDRVILEFNLYEDEQVCIEPADNLMDKRVFILE